MKEYSFVVDDFLPRESKSPDGILLQMTTDKAEIFLKQFSDIVQSTKNLYPETTMLLAVTLCGTLFLDSINGSEAQQRSVSGDCLPPIVIRSQPHL